MGGSPLGIEFLELFAICSRLVLLVSLAVHNGNWNVSFRRTVGPKETVCWAGLRVALPLMLLDDPDAISWRFPLCDSSLLLGISRAVTADDSLMYHSFVKSALAYED